jgi:hypothetical protein
MNDVELRCDSCTRAIEKPKRTYLICQPCLNAIVERAVAA